MLNNYNCLLLLYFQILRTSTNIINSICDPDTSDEDSAEEENKHKYNYKTKTMKSTSPKPLRVSYT